MSDPNTETTTAPPAASTGASGAANGAGKGRKGRGGNRGGRTAAPANETATDRFRRMGNLRFNKVRIALIKLSQLNSGRYERTPEQIETIRAALHTGVDQACDRLKPGGAAAQAVAII